jgi:ABC-type branched-subunit amino acid transport system ATPase component
VLVLYAPSGLTSLAERWRDAALGWLIARTGTPAADLSDPDDAPMAATPNRLGERADDAADGPRHRSRDDVVLQVRGLSKSFGGITAVRGVDLDVRAGEVLGVMGQNGAGKTTLFEMLTGFVKPDGGTVVFDGRSIGRYRPEARARLGLVRSFQDSRLFPTLTVREVLCCAQERTIGNGPLDALFGGHQPERARQGRADDLIELMRLGPFARRRVTELSTGTRRIVELACMVALDPRVLLLDEPSSGIAQRESEVLASLLLQVRDYLDATLVVIEHDVPLLLSISDRILAMEAGQALLVDRPEVVIADERVVSSYLGTDRTAIDRTNAPVPAQVAVAGTRT